MRRFFLITCILMAIYTLAGTVAAQELPPTISVSPALTELKLDPGQQHTIELSLFNSTNEVQELDVSTANLSTEDVTGNWVLNMHLQNEAQGWISIPQSQISIPAGELIKYQVELQIPGGASPGQHSVIILFTDEINEQTDTLARGELGAVIIIEVSGNPLTRAEIVDFQPVETFNEFLPLQVQTLIANTGNTLVTPKGAIELSLDWGIDTARTYYTINFNDDNIRVWRESTRQIVTVWPDEPAIRMGLYTARITFAYGAENEILQAETRILVLPSKAIAAIVIPVLFILSIVAIKVRRKRK